VSASKTEEAHQETETRDEEEKSKPRKHDTSEQRQGQTAAKRDRADRADGGENERKQTHR